MATDRPKTPASLRTVELLLLLEPLKFACIRISGLVVEYIVAIDVTRVRFLADA